MLAAKDNSIAHAAAPLQHLDAAITMRSATSRRQPESLYAHGNTTWQQSCSHSTAICNPRFQLTIQLRMHESTHSTLRPQQQCGNKKNIKTIVPAPAAHAMYLSVPAGGTLPEKTQGFVPRLSPKTKPVQHPYNPYNAFCTITSPTGISPYAHGNTIWQHSCSHHTTAHARIYPQHLEATATVWEQKKHQNDRARTRRTRNVPFSAGRRHFTRKNARFRAPAFSQNEAHVKSHTALHCCHAPPFIAVYCVVM